MKTSIRLSGALLLSGLCAPAATVWYAGAGANASDSKDGTLARPVKSVGKEVSLAKPGDTVVFGAGTYACSQVAVPNGSEGLPVTLRREGKGYVVFTNDGTGPILVAGSYNTVDGIEFHMTSEKPRGAGIEVPRKEHVIIRNCRFFACQNGVRVVSSHYVKVANSEMAYSGANGITCRGGGDGPKGHLNLDDENKFIEVRNCYLHDAGWNTRGTEGYGINVYGAAENVTIEICQMDNNSGDGFLYEDWTVHSTARYNVIRGSGIAAIWIDNASMSVFDSNYLEANNVAVWLSGEESSNRFLSDFVAIRNNIVVHNDYSAIDPSVYGRVIFMITSSTRDTYFDNNTVAFNKCQRVVGVQNRPPQNIFGNVWFRNNIFWQNTGGVGADKGINFGEFRFVNNLWDKPFPGDAEAKTGDPLFVDAKSHEAEGYRLRGESAARDRGMLLYENPLDFWNGMRPHLANTGKYDIGAHEYGSKGTARIGLDMAAFPFEVPPFKVRFRTKPPM
jgi:hypothetical protein